MIFATPYRFTPDVIRKVVPSGKIGVYALGDVDGGKFTVKYVGRSDCSLQKRLLTHNMLYQFSYFIFLFTETQEEGFVLEAKWWHDCKVKRLPVANQIHPDSPSRAELKCPYCEFTSGMKHFLKSELDVASWQKAS